MQEPIMNIILIISDSLRRDHLGCYGNSGMRTPHLDRLANRSIVFDQCYPASYPTIPMRSDVLTGKYDFTYLGWAPLPASEYTLPQLLSSETRYYTAGIADTPFYVRNGYGYDRGFHDFIWNRGQRPGLERDDVAQAWRYEEDMFAPKSFRMAERWVEKHYKDPFFLLVDTWDPHEPWDAPAHYVEMYMPNYDGQPSPYPCYWYWKEAGTTQAEIDLAHAHYCAEVTMVDRSIGRLLERLESLDLMKNTAIIFTADHGFYFGEHERFGKGMLKSEHGYLAGHQHIGPKLVPIFRSPSTGKVSPGEGRWQRSALYNEVTRVPLIIYLPDAEPRRIDGLANIPDLMPTVLDLAGVPVPQIVQAKSLKPLLIGQSSTVRDFLVTSWPLSNPGQRIRVVDDYERRMEAWQPSSITDGRYSLLYAAKGEPVELYDTATDPKQETNIIATNEQLALELHRRFIDLLEEVDTPDVLLEPRRELQ